MSHPVLITGASQRLGLAIANDLLSRSVPVIITYRTPKPAVTQLEADGASTIQADFSTAQGIDRAIDAIQAATSGLRAIIHNASDWEPESEHRDYQSLIETMMQVHAIAPYRLNLALQSLLQGQGSTTDIIHMTDYVQLTGSQKHVAYSASKAALHNLTLSFAKMLAPDVKVNSIAPALLMFNDDDPQAYRDKARKKSLLETVPGAQEAVKAVNYLLSSDYMTGQTLHLDGGRHLK
ncbi:dihydromonapterin reductase [Alteromonas sp. ASW11-19]|uniref:Dihydromonapterin reductase n=1 Tax=Alteromonas salexigens TaxID=2982530 RepID=A0ABT2VQ61_9ALTE|nr:dihydromonapterin reductase [Alteromonas salexigens]MCU7554593.1 dihydromonapterin reductase [Alteromonas salexigens]